MDFWGFGVDLDLVDFGCFVDLYWMFHDVP